MTDSVDVEIAFRNLEQRINEASSQFREWAELGEWWMEPSWLIESCFLQLLALTEALALPEFRALVLAEYTSIKRAKGEFTAKEGDPDGPYSPVLSRIRCFTEALRQLFPGDEKTTVTRDLLQIIRDIHYVITDTPVFARAPANEADVHARVEAVLKCVFPDLKHKPALTKQIKNFEPDTGIPSLETLVEYKFLSRKEDAARVADELLADTRGYTSKDWRRFLYVIYETGRFRMESDWNQLLRESGVPINTVAVVLSGEPIPSKRASRKRPRTTKAPGSPKAAASK